MKTLLLVALLGAQSAPATDDIRPPHRCDANFYKVEVSQSYDGDVHITCGGLDDEAMEEVAAMMARVRQELEGLGLGQKGTLYVRLRHADHYLDPANYYSNENTITTSLPCNTYFQQGGPLGFDPVLATLDVMAEASWRWLIRPLTFMPTAAREAINRLVAETLLAELGEDGAWWPGTARPRPGSLFSLAPDHPLVVRRNGILTRLEAYVDAAGREALAGEGANSEVNARRRGIQILLAKLDLWGRKVLDGREVYEQLTALLAPAGAGEDFRLIPAKDFQVREPFQAETWVERMRGLRATVPRGSKLLLEHGDLRVAPRHFLSVKNGDPTVVYPLPDTGTYRYSFMDVVLRRKGAFADEPFDVVLMDEEGQETFRWSYRIRSLPDAADGPPGWTQLGNTRFSYARPGFFVALEFPELRDDQDVEIGFYPRQCGDRSFWRQDPVFRSVEEPGDFAMKVQFNARAAPNFPKMLSFTRKFEEQFNQ